MGFYPSGSKVEPIMCVLLSPLIRVSHYQSVTIWILDLIERSIAMLGSDNLAHLQSSVFKLSKDLIDSIHEEGIVAYTS